MRASLCFWTQGLGTRAVQDSKHMKRFDNLLRHVGNRKLKFCLMVQTHVSVHIRADRIKFRFALLSLMLEAQKLFTKLIVCVACLNNRKYLTSDSVFTLAHSPNFNVAQHHPRKHPPNLNIEIRWLGRTLKHLHQNLKLSTAHGGEASQARNKGACILLRPAFLDDTGARAVRCAPILVSVSRNHALIFQTRAAILNSKHPAYRQHSLFFVHTMPRGVRKTIGNSFARLTPAARNRIIGMALASAPKSEMRDKVRKTDGLPPSLRAIDDDVFVTVRDNPEWDN
jgi:hypothetical protein